jgi:hypothetical protein
MTALVGLCHSGDSIAGIQNSYFYQAFGFASTGDAGVVLMQSSAIYYYGKDLIARNMAITGTRLGGASPNLNALAPGSIDTIIPTSRLYPPLDRVRKYIFTTAIGSNDGALGGFATPALYAAAVAACCQARKAAGYDLVGMCTLLPRNDGVMTEPNRTTYDSTLTGVGWAAANQIDFICDLASDSIMGDPANCSNTMWYVDGVHPTTAGYARLAPIYLASILAAVATLG